MAGVYGEIDSRADFERVVKEARAITAGMLKMNPNNRPIESIDTQLDAMQRWTAGGREPTEDERKTISVALIAVRELDDDRKGAIRAVIPQPVVARRFGRRAPRTCSLQSTFGEPGVKRLGSPATMALAADA
jgi:hypothetical protein